MNAFDLNGKTVLVTGASSGLGRQTAITASEYGAKVIVTGRDEKRLEETYHSLQGAGHMKFIADLTVQEDIDHLVSGLPTLNGLVHSTGISELTPARFITAETIARTFRISFDASVLLTSGILKKKKLEKGNSSIVFISSISTRYPFVGGAMYISAESSARGVCTRAGTGVGAEGYEGQLHLSRVCPHSHADGYGGKFFPGSRG